MLTIAGSRPKSNLERLAQIKREAASNQLDSGKLLAMFQTTRDKFPHLLDQPCTFRETYPHGWSHAD